MSLSASDLSALAAYVAQTDGSEATAPVNVRRGHQTGESIGHVGKSVTLQIVATDADGDSLT